MWGGVALHGIASPQRNTRPRCPPAIAAAGAVAETPESKLRALPCVHTPGRRRGSGPGERDPNAGRLGRACDCRGRALRAWPGGRRGVTPSATARSRPATPAAEARPRGRRGSPLARALDASGAGAVRPEMSGDVHTDVGLSRLTSGGGWWGFARARRSRRATAQRLMVIGMFTADQHFEPWSGAVASQGSGEGAEGESSRSETQVAKPKRFAPDESCVIDLAWFGTPAVQRHPATDSDRLGGGQR